MNCLSASKIQTKGAMVGPGAVVRGREFIMLIIQLTATGTIWTARTTRCMSRSREFSPVRAWRWWSKLTRRDRRQDSQGIWSSRSPRYRCVRGLRICRQRRDAPLARPSKSDDEAQALELSIRPTLELSSNWPRLRSPPKTREDDDLQGGEQVVAALRGKRA